MRNLIPDFILKQAADQQKGGSVKASVVFIDISGFTAMTSSLMQNGKEGAEIVSAVINNIFTPAIEQIRQNNGFIATFAGDAFTAVFPYENRINRALDSAMGIINVFKTHGNQSTRFGNYQLSVKIGLADGDVNWKIITADSQSAYYFNGTAIDQSAACEHHAGSLELIADQSVIDSADDSILKSLKIESGYYKILEVKPFKSDGVFAANADNSAYISNFMPNLLSNMRTRGEFRQVISCFISFDPDLQIDSQLKEVINLCQSYGGYFNKIDFGDKGGVILILFGAPVALEKLFIRASNFLFAVQSISGLKCRSGMTFGTAFTGFVGSKIREEYTALGETVNLAARLMMQADTGKILCDKTIFEECKTSCNFDYLGELPFKGFTELQPVYQMTGKKNILQTNEENENTRFIGREDELRLIRARISSLIENKKSGILNIEGLAGIGKSRLLESVRSEYLNPSQNNLNWYILPCDEILKKSFNPVIHFIKDFFQMEDKTGVVYTYPDFLRKFSLWVSSCSKDYRKDLIENAEFIAALCSVFETDSLYQRLEAKERLTRTDQALQIFFTALANHKPLILQLEDAHWADRNSLDFFNKLMRKVPRSLLLAVTVRLNDDGSSLNLFKNTSDTTSILLNNLNSSEVKNLVHYQLRNSGLNIKNIDKELLSFVLEKSEGNPFFCNQILLYLTENKLITDDGHLLKNSTVIPPGINAIILARIDRLTAEVRETIKTASVLGREFSVEILSAMLKNILIRETLKTAEDEVIWNHLSEIKYIFHHALIRESIYELQLKEQLRKLHNLAAETIEDFHQNDKLSVCHELSEHYYRAENFVKGTYYLKIAAEQAENNFHNQTALDLYAKLQELLTAQNQTQSDLYLHSLIHCGIINYATGEVKTAEILHRQAIELAGKAQNSLRLSEAKRYLGNIYLDRGMLQEAFDLYEECEKISSSSNDQHGLMSAIGNIGLIYHTIGDYSKAKKYFTRRLKIAQQNDLSKEIARSYNYLGLLYYTENDYAKALEIYKKALISANKIQFLKLQIELTYNIASVYYMLTDYSKAVTYNRKALSLNKSTGNILKSAQIIGNIGLVYYDQADYKKALHLFLQKYRSVNLLDNLKELIVTSGNIGDVYFELGLYDMALKFYQDQLNYAVIGRDKANEADAYGNLGNVEFIKQNYKSAFSHYSSKKKLSRQIKNSQHLIDSIMSLSNIYYAQEKYHISIKSLKSVLKKARQSKLLLTELTAEINLAQNLLLCNSFTEAIDIITAIMPKIEKNGDLKNLSLAMLILADAYTSLKDFEQAENYYLKAQELSRKTGSKNILTTILNNQAALYLKTGQLLQAGELNQTALTLAEEIKTPNDIFAAKFLQAKILAASNKDNAIILLKDMSTSYPVIKEQSRIVWLLTKLTDDEKLQKKAVKLLNRQIKKTDNPEYGEMLKDLL